MACTGTYLGQCCDAQHDATVSVSLIQRGFLSPLYPNDPIARWRMFSGFSSLVQWNAGFNGETISGSIRGTGTIVNGVTSTEFTSEGSGSDLLTLYLVKSRRWDVSETRVDSTWFSGYDCDGDILATGWMDMGAPLPFVAALAADMVNAASVESAGILPNGVSVSFSAGGRAYTRVTRDRDPFTQVPPTQCNGVGFAAVTAIGANSSGVDAAATRIVRAPAAGYLRIKAYRLAWPSNARTEIACSSPLLEAGLDISAPYLEDGEVERGMALADFVTNTPDPCSL